MRQHPLRDALGARPLAARWVIQGQLKLETALHLGGGKGEHVDMPVLRDSRSGRPLLPGTTFAGALRSALADRLVGFGVREEGEVAHLFGGDRRDDEGVQSPLIVFDALGTLPKGAIIEARDGVAIAPSTGIAEDHKKYDYEVLPAGTTFQVRVDLLVPMDKQVEVEQSVPINKQVEAELLADLEAALDTFSKGDGGFGARRSRGMGRTTATWAAKRYDLSTRAGWIEWARSEHDPVLPPQLTSIHNALKTAGWTPPAKARLDARSLVRFNLELHVAHDILVRSPKTDPSAPDASQLYSGGKAILPGTSLAGVLRAQALRIAQLVRSRHGDGEGWVDRLFGPRFEGQRATPGFEPHASRLRVGESSIELSASCKQTRIAIDRFTQGVVDGALFEEQPEVGGKILVTMDLRSPKPGELGLVLLVLKDLLAGRLPVGGTSSVGRGFLTGTVKISTLSGGESPVLGELRSGAKPSAELASRVNEAIREFHEIPALVDPRSPTGVAETLGDQS